MLNVWQMALLLLAAFLAGALGACTVLLVYHRKSRKQQAAEATEAQIGIRTAKRIVRPQTGSSWRENARNEQLYNGR